MEVPMKHLIKFYAIICIVILYMAGCSSNERFPGRSSPGERAKQLKEALDLTDEQTSSVEKIYTDMDKKMSGLRDKLGDDRAAMRDSMRVYRAETDTLIENVLFEDQIVKYHEYNEQRRENMRQRRRDSGRDN